MKLATITKKNGLETFGGEGMKYFLSEKFFQHLGSRLS